MRRVGEEEEGRGVSRRRARPLYIAAEGCMRLDTRRTSGGDWTTPRRLDWTPTRIDSPAAAAERGRRGEWMSTPRRKEADKWGRWEEARERRPRARAFLSSGDPKRPPARWVWVGIAGLSSGPIRRYLSPWGRDWGIFLHTALFSSSWGLLGAQLEML